MTEEIRALFIFEILGRPPEHIKTALEEFVNKIGEQKGIKILNKKIHEPRLIEDKESKNLYTTFAEVELNISSIELLFGVVINMLPSSVEILYPPELRLKNFDLSLTLSNLAAKLHRYDEIAKTLMLENNNLVNRIKELEMSTSTAALPSVNISYGDKNNKETGKKDKNTKKTSSKKKR